MHVSLAKCTPTQSRHTNRATAGRLFRWTKATQIERKALAAKGELSVLVHVDSLGDRGHKTKSVADKWVAAMATLLDTSGSIVKGGMKTWRVWLYQSDSRACMTQRTCT